MIDDVEADEYYFVSHANYQEIGCVPPITNPKLTHYIGVSQFAVDKLEEYGKKLGKKIKIIKCYNPLTLEPKEKVMHLISATRLDDKVKGGERTIKLIEALDRYCEKTGRHYIWTIFSNPVAIKIDSPNVALMKQRVDVRPYVANADYVIQLSNDMETYCYTINEALGYGVPIVTTPLSICKELPIDENMSIELKYDCSNVDEVAKQIFEKEVKPFKYSPPEDSWEDFIIKEKSTYEEEKEMMYLVEATNKYERTNTSDNQLSDKYGKRYVPKQGEQWEVDFARKETLVELGFATLIKVVTETEKKKTKKVAKK